MKIEWFKLGDNLLAACSKCRKEAVLVAPFMKGQALTSIVEALPASASLICLTRWRLEEIYAGASDLDCWRIISSRPNSRLMLLNNLHAKYFRFDQSAYLGSANLTRAALGWSRRPNLEALVEFDTTTYTVDTFEKALFVGASEVTYEMWIKFKGLLEAFADGKPPVQLAPLETAALDIPETNQFDSWYPHSRSPEILYKVYAGDTDAASRDGLTAARADLIELDLPINLSEVAFSNLIRSRMATMLVLVKLDTFLVIDRRFGEIRSWLATQLGIKDATDEWQRLMRWLLFFMPDQYETFTPNYSEIFRLRTTHDV